MPAGSGPIVTQVTAGSIGTSEVAVAVSPFCNFNNPNGIGNLISAAINYSASAAQTLTLRIRQGNGVTGALVSVAQPLTIAAAGNVMAAMQVQDSSAFANGPTVAGVYTFTAQSSIAGPGTVVQALLEVETVAPVI